MVCGFCRVTNRPSAKAFHFSVYYSFCDFYLSCFVPHDWGHLYEHHLMVSSRLSQFYIKPSVASTYRYANIILSTTNVAMSRIFWLPYQLDYLSCGCLFCSSLHGLSIYENLITLLGWRVPFRYGMSHHGVVYQRNWTAHPTEICLGPELLPGGGCRSLESFGISSIISIHEHISLSLPMLYLAFRKYLSLLYRKSEHLKRY